MLFLEKFWFNIEFLSQIQIYIVCIIRFYYFKIRMKKVWVLFSFILFAWVTSAYFPWKSERTCDDNTDVELKDACEIEKSFLKFTETTGTREMSTTCCSYLEHDPQFYYYMNNKRNAWNTESWDVQKLDDLVLNLTSKIYKTSKNKLSTLNILSSLFKSCSENWKTDKIKAVCQHFSYDFIWRNPVLSQITFEDIKSSLKTEKTLLKRTAQFSDLDENYFPVNDHYAGVLSEYMLWDYAFWIIQTYDYFKKLVTDDRINRITKLYVLKAWDTHWQDFADVWIIYSIEWLRLWFENHKISLYVPNTVEDFSTKRLTSQYELQDNGNWNLVWCYEEDYNDNSAYDLKSSKKLKISDCEKNRITINTTIGK